MIFIAALSKEILEQRRTKKLFIATIVLILFGMTSPLLAKMTPQIITMVPGGEALGAIIPTPTINDAIAQYIKNTTQFGILLALIFSMGSVCQEKEKGTAAMILSKPMPRSIFILAKFTALAMTFVLPIFLSGLVCYYYTYLLFGQLEMGPWLMANGLIALYILVFIAVTLFFSAVTGNQYAAIGLSFCTLIFFSVVAGLPKMANALPDSLIQKANLLARGETTDLWLGLWVSFIVIFVSLVGACGFYRKREI
ncbi:MAG: ABC transporter permease [Chloroflexi bacterium]|nr:ABC transporter permease [Chloroflexota bacterium]